MVSSDEESVDETLGLPGYTYNPKVKEANEKLRSLNTSPIPEKTSSNRTIRFDENVQIKETSKSFTNSKSESSGMGLAANDSSSSSRSEKLNESGYNNDFDRDNSEENMLPRKKKNKKKPLWTDEPPGTPQDLPAHMRPLKNNSKRRTYGQPYGPSSFMIGHMEKLKNEFPHLKSKYEMSAEQKMALKKRQETEKQIENEKRLMELEEERIHNQTNHEVWQAWYENRMMQQRDERKLTSKQNRREKQKAKQHDEFLQESRKDAGLDFTTWKKTKDKEIKAQLKLERSNTIDNTEDELKKMKQNDRAFRKWLRKREKEQRFEALIQQEADRLRKIEVRREHKTKKALAAVRAAQDQALKNKGFVF